MPSELPLKPTFCRVASMPDDNVTNRRVKIPGSHGSPYSARQRVDIFHSLDSQQTIPLLAPSSPLPSQVFPSSSPSVFQQTPGLRPTRSISWRTPGLAASPSVGQGTPGTASSQSIAQRTPVPARPRVAALSTTAAYSQSPSVRNTI